MSPPTQVDSRPAGPQPRADRRTRVGVRRLSVAEFLVALVLLIVAAPFLQSVPNGRLIEAVLLTLALVSAVLAVGARRRTLALAVILVLPVLLGKWANHFRPDLVPPALFLVAGLLFVAFVTVQLIRFVLRAPRVTTEALYAGIAGYLMMGLLWVMAYLLVAQADPDAFVFTVGPENLRTMNGFNALYFSFVTLSTVGYGGIVPVASVARMLAMMEATSGLLYTAVLIARLVALHTMERPATGAEEQRKSD